MNFDEALRLIHDHNPRTREEAARTLGLFYDTDAVAVLLDGLQTDPDERVKISIIRALGNVFALEAVSTLEAMLWASGLSPILSYEVKNALTKIEEYRDKQPEDARIATDTTRAIPRDTMGEVPDAGELVSQALTAVDHHEHDLARNLLRAAVQIDPYHEIGWLWLSLFVDTVGEQRICLENVLHLNPDNERARKMLEMLTRHSAENPSGIGKADAKLYTVGGNVKPDGAIYIKRPADDELFQNCLDGTLSFVLTSRQRGKSSIVVQTSLRLEAQNVATINVDLSSMGTTPQSIDEFYFGVLYVIVKRFGVTMRELSRWWKEMERLSPVQRFDIYLREELLSKVDVPIVVFVDEVDTVRSYNKMFPVDDFFAVIRALYNARAMDERCRRLTFVLLGVAQPTDLIEEGTRTPFNIGSRIDLTDFNLLEAMELADGLGLPLDKSRKVMGWVLYWTDGHPNLSQKVCRELAKQPSSTRNQQSVEVTIKRLFLSPDSPDDNIQMVEGMFISHPDSVQLIILYYRILVGINISESDDKQIVEQIEYLKLAGIVRTKAGKLVVRNRIYAAYFDEGWIEERLRSVIPMEELKARYADEVAQLPPEAETIFTRIKPLERPLATLKQAGEAGKKAPNKKRAKNAEQNGAKHALPETELLKPDAAVPDTDQLDGKAGVPVTERPTEPLSDYLTDLESLEPAKTNLHDEETDPLGWLRDMPGDYLLDVQENSGQTDDVKPPWSISPTAPASPAPDTRPVGQQNVQPPKPKISLTGNIDETYDWMANISPEDLQHAPRDEPDEDEQIISQEMVDETPDEVVDEPVQMQASDDEASVDIDFPAQESEPSDPFGVYIESLDEDEVYRDATSDWLEEYVADIDEDDLLRDRNLSPAFHREDADLPAPEQAETVEELDDIWLEAINNAIEKYTLLPDFPDDDLDAVTIDDAGWLNNFADDELFLYPPEFGEIKRGDVVFLPEAELEFRFDGRFFLLKTPEMQAEAVSLAEAVFQPLYLELAESPEPYSLDSEDFVLPDAQTHWRTRLSDFLVDWRGAILLVISLLFFVLAGASGISGAGASTTSVILLAVGVAMVIPAGVFIRRDWLGADVLQDRLERIAQTEVHPAMQKSARPALKFGSAETLNSEALSADETSRRILPNVDSYLANRWFARRWKRQLQLAGIEISLTQFALLHVVSALGALIFGAVISGGQVVVALLVGVVGLCMPQFYTAFAISNRVSRFKNQLPDALGLWVNALRSGYSMIQAMESISRDAPEPTATEFKRTVQEIQLGIEIEIAYEHLLNRVDDEDLDFVLTAVNIQREVGGNLAEILEVIGHTIRERVKMAGETVTQVKARYRTFFLIAALLPFLQTVAFTPYFEQALTTITGQLALMMGYTLIAITLTFSANTNHVLRRTTVSADNFWISRRDRLFDLGVGMLILALVFALGTAPLLVLWLGLMLFVIVMDYTLLGLILSIPVVATAVFTDGDISGIPSQLGDALSTQTAFGLGTLVIIFGVVGAIVWRIRQYRQKNPQSLVDVRLITRPINRILRSAAYVAPAKGIVKSLAGKISPNLKDDDPTIDNVTAVFYARCFLWALILGGFGVWLGVNANAMPLTTAAYALTGASIGYFIPPLRRYNQRKREQEQIRMALPDALDLLVICMEAGLGFDSAMGKVYEKWDNELALAFGRVLREIQLGKLRREAMRDMALRLDVTEVDSFVAAIIQSDQLGVSLARTMRIQSDQIRVGWRQRFTNIVNTNNQIMDQLSLFLFVPGINLWLIAPIIARMFA